MGETLAGNDKKKAGNKQKNAGNHKKKAGNDKKRFVNGQLGCLYGSGRSEGDPKTIRNRLNPAGNEGSSHGNGINAGRNEVITAGSG